MYAKKELFPFLLSFCFVFKRKKRRLLTGGLSSVCIISIVRLIELLSIRFINTLSDMSKNAVVVAILNMLEVNIAVVCACITTIKPVLARFFPRLFASDWSGSESGSGGESEAWSGELERARACHGRQGADDLVDHEIGHTATVFRKAEEPSRPEAIYDGCRRI